MASRLMRVLQVGRTARFTSFRQGSRNGASVLTSGVGHNCTHERSDGNSPISMKSWAGEVQSFTRPSPRGELRSDFVGLGDKDNERTWDRIFGVNDNERIALRFIRQRNFYYCATAMQEYSTRGRHESRPFVRRTRAVRLRCWI